MSVTNITTIPAVLLTATLGQLTEAHNVSQVSLWDLVDDHHAEAQRDNYQASLVESLPPITDMNTTKVYCVYLKEYTSRDIAEFWDSTERIVF